MTGNAQDPSTTAYWLMGLAIFVSIAIAVGGGLLNKLWRELENKVPRGEYVEYRKGMKETVSRLQQELDSGHSNFRKINDQLVSINMILMAVAVKLEVTDVEKVIKTHIKGGTSIS